MNIPGLPEKHIPLQDETEQKKEGQSDSSIIMRFQAIVRHFQHLLQKTGLTSTTEQEKKLWTLITDFPEMTMLVKIIVVVLNVIIAGRKY